MGMGWDEAGGEQQEATGDEMELEQEEAAEGAQPDGEFVALNWKPPRPGIPMTRDEGAKLIKYKVKYIERKDLGIADFIKLSAEALSGHRSAETIKSWWKRSGAVPGRQGGVITPGALVEKAAEEGKDPIAEYKELFDMKKERHSQGQKAAAAKRYARVW